MWLGLMPVRLFLSLFAMLAIPMKAVEYKGSPSFVREYHISDIDGYWPSV